MSEPVTASPPRNNLAYEIAMGVARCIALVIGGGMVVYAVVKLNSNAALISVGGAMVTFATGASVANKAAAHDKIQTALTLPAQGTPA